MAVLGDTVLYGISTADEQAVNLRGLIKGEALGRSPKVGDVQPALVVKVNADTTLDLHLFLDASATHWTRGVVQGATGTAGAWWPKV